MTKKVTDKHLKSVKSRQFQVFFLFLLMSFCLLIVTKLSKNYVHKTKLKITYKNVPLELVIPSSDNYDLTVTVKASGFEILYNTLFKNSVEIDFLNDVESTDEAYIWYYLSNQLKLKKAFKSSIQVVDVFPKQFHVPFEKESSKKVPILLNSNITLFPGYDFIKPSKIEPDSILIVGSKKDLELIKSIDTELLNLNKLQSNYEAPLKIIVPKLQSPIKVSHTAVNVNVLVDKFTEGTIEVPVVVKNIPQNVSINFFPKRILVTYYMPLNEYGNLKASDFKINCDFNSVLDTDYAFMIAQLNDMPTTVKQARLSNDKVEFIFLK